MLIVYFFPPSVPQSSDLQAPWQKVEENAAAGGRGGTFSQLAWGGGTGQKIRGLWVLIAMCLVFPSRGAGTGQPHPATYHDLEVLQPFQPQGPVISKWLKSRLGFWELTDVMVWVTRSRDQIDFSS